MRAASSRVDPVAAPRRAPLAPCPAEAHPPGAPRRPAAPQHSLSSRSGARRGQTRTRTSPRIHHARAPHPAPGRGPLRSKGARGRPGRRCQRSPGHVPDGRASSRRSAGAGAREPRSLGRRRRRFRVGGAHVTATGLRAAPAAAVAAPAAAAAATAAPASAGREITIKGRAAAGRKRKRCLPSRSAAAGARTKGGRPPTRLPAPHPTPPRRGPAASRAPRQRARRPGTAPRRPPPQTQRRGAGQRVAGGDGPGARGWDDLGQVTALGERPCGLRQGEQGRLLAFQETPAPGGAGRSQGHSTSGRATA